MSTGQNFLDGSFDFLDKNNFPSVLELIQQKKVENPNSPNLSHPTTVEIGLKKDPRTGEKRLSVSQISDRRIRIEKKLKAISTLVKQVEDRGGDWCERDLNNLEQDINEVLVRNLELTGMEVT